MSVWKKSRSASGSTEAISSVVNTDIGLKETRTMIDSFCSVYKYTDFWKLHEEQIHLHEVFPSAPKYREVLQIFSIALVL